MAQIIIYKNSNGGVSVTKPSGEISIEEVLVKDCPNHAIIVDDSELPSEHENFFDAWELVDKKIIVSLDKAKEITKKRLRREREPFLTAQDVAFQRALESGADTSAIVSEKSRLRDITKLADQALNLEYLKVLKVLAE